MGVPSAPDNIRARELLRLVATGDEVAYRELYGMLSQRVYAFLRRMLNHADIADDVLVDTMYEVWCIASQFRGDSLVSTWVMGIARNKALMALRSSGSAMHEDIDDFAEIIDSGVPDGFDQLAEKESRAIIKRCIERLSEKHRECIHLTHFEDLSLTSAASLLGVPEGTVKSRLSHARMHLAACVSAALRRGDVL